MYFIIMSSDSTILSKDGQWVPKAVAKKDPSRVLGFEDLFAAEEYKRTIPIQHRLEIQTAKTAGKRFGNLAGCTVYQRPSIVKNTVAVKKSERPGEDDTLSVSKAETGKDDKDEETKPRIRETNNLNETFYTPLIQDTIDVLERLEAMLERWEMAAAELPAELSECNGAVTDFYHYIEFSKLGGVKGYEAYRKLHELLIKRRRCKNELAVVQKAADALRICPDGYQEMSEKVQAALTCIDRLEHQSYAPRFAWPD